MAIGRRQYDRQTLVYGWAHFGKSLFWYTSELLFAYYLSEVCNLPPRAMGGVLALGFMVGAVTDVVIGHGFARFLRRADQASQFQLIGAALSAVALLAIFLDAFLPQAVRLIYAICTGLLFRIAYAAYDLPQNALVSLGTDSADARSRVAGLRIFFSGAATLLVSATTAAILALHVSVKPMRFLVAAILWCVIGLGSAWKLSRLSWGRVEEKPEPLSGVTSAVAPSSSLASPRIILLLSLAFIVSATTSSFSKIEPYYTSYVLRDPVWGGMVLASVGVGSAISQPLWVWLALKLSRRTMFMICGCGILCASLVFWVTCKTPEVAIAIAFAFGAASSGFGTTLWAAYGDAIKAIGDGPSSLGYGLLTAVMKVALAVGVLAIGEGLSLFDYRTLQSDLLMVLMCLVPAAGAGLVTLMNLGFGAGPRLTQLPEKHLL